MNIKEIFDNDNKFLFDTGEFADEHYINDKKVSVIVDKDALMERQKKEFDGIYIADILFFVKSSEIATPKIGCILKFDNIPYIVIDVRDSNNILEILLKRNAAI